MLKVSPVRLWLGGVAFAAAGLAFLLYPVIRPFSDETSLQGAAAFGSTAWIVAHSLAIGAFVLLGLGTVCVYLVLQQGRAERLGFASLLLVWTGIGLTLPFYGAEVFGLHAIGQAALQRHDASLVGLAADVRGQPGIWFIVVGLLVLAGGTIVLAIAFWRSEVFSRWTGIPLALGFALYLPQFMTPQYVRWLHGLFIAFGCAVIGTNLRLLARVSSRLRAPS